MIDGSQFHDLLLEFLHAPSRRIRRHLFTFNFGREGKAVDFELLKPRRKNFDVGFGLRAFYFNVADRLQQRRLQRLQRPTLVKECLQGIVRCVGFGLRPTLLNFQPLQFFHKLLQPFAFFGFIQPFEPRAQFFDFRSGHFNFFGGSLSQTSGILFAYRRGLQFHLKLLGTTRNRLTPFFGEGFGLLGFFQNGLRRRFRLLQVGEFFVEFRKFSFRFLAFCRKFFLTNRKFTEAFRNLSLPGTPRRQGRH